MRPRDRGPADSSAPIDLLKALACCLIVLHHLAFYGPMADHADDLLPQAFDWLAQHGRLAVQVFLVLGGYLAARSVAAAMAPLPGSQASASAVLKLGLRLIGRRFVRLALPLWAALVMAIGCNALADHWMDHASISQPPGVVQFVSHLLLLQDLVGHEALSAGLWYVAIDFQLFVILATLAVIGRLTRHPSTAIGVMAITLLAASGLWWNRDPALDVIGPYFWVSYGLGVLVGLRCDRTVLLAGLAVVVAALWLEPRIRLLLALGTAVILWACLQEWSAALAQADWPWARRLSRVSYSVFLTHFPISLIINAAWTAFLPSSPWLQLVGVLVAFKLSVLGGALFHAAVEAPAARWAAGLGWARPA